MFKVGNMVHEKYPDHGGVLEGLSLQDIRKRYFSSVKVLTVQDLKRGWYTKESMYDDTTYTYKLENCILSGTEDSVYTPLYLNMIGRTQTISLKKYNESMWDAIGVVAKIRFKGIKVNSQGHVKDNMFYFYAFGELYKTKVYLTKDDEWRGIDL